MLDEGRAVVCRSLVARPLGLRFYTCARAHRRAPPRCPPLAGIIRMRHALRAEGKNAVDTWWAWPPKTTHPLDLAQVTVSQGLDIGKRNISA